MTANAFATYDFETWDWVNPFVYCVYTPESHSYAVERSAKPTTSTAETCLRSMEAYARTGIKIFWAHNGGKFDALFLVDAIQHMSGWKCNGITASGRIISLRITSPSATFTLKDSYAVIQSSLAKALESFEVPCSKMFTASDYEGDMRKLSDTKLLDGCLADCKALHQLLERTQSLCEAWGGELKSTFSSSALSLLKAHIARPLPSHKDKQWANEVCRKAYCGGRVEIFTHQPQHTLRYYDIASSYPWSMTQPLPWELIGWDEPRLYDNSVRQIIYATVAVPEQTIPPLPFSPPTKGLFFPVGSWSGWFVGDELKYAIEECGVTAKFHEAVSYTVETPFKSFIDTCYETKRTSTGAKREFAKLSMNGCIGKFGQRPENTYLMMFASTADGIAFARASKNEIRPLSRDWTALEVSHHKWPSHTHYALGSYILALSRIKLHRYMRQTLGLAYCDTDSVQSFKSDKLDAACGSELGDLKVEIRAMRAQYYAPKLYKLTDEATGEHVYKSKGFPVDAQSFKNIIDMQKVGNKKGRMQLIRTQLKHKSGVRHFNEIETEKMWNGRSNKRRIIPGSEGLTEPWTADELIEGVHLDQKSPGAASA